MAYLKRTFEHINSRYIKLVLFAVIFCFNLFQINLHFKGRYENLIVSDARGYFEYLPYVFVFHDVEHIYYSYKLDNGKRFDKYPCGVAILESPFFMASLLIQNPPIDKTASYGKSYAMSVAVAASFYLALSFLLLFSFYRKLFNVNTALVCLVILYFGTNLYYYSIYEPGMSHVYSFFCFSAFLFCLDRFFTKASVANIFSTAFFLSLALAVRPTNAIMAMMYPFYNVSNKKDLVRRLQFLIRNYKFMVISILTAGVVFLPQFLYWYKTTGHFIFYSYGVNDESFLYWKTPKILEVLFGVQAGWLPYTPMMMFFFIGLFFIIKKRGFHSLAILVVFAAILYCCSSWWKYNFACAFGYRSFVEYYILFIIPVGYLVFVALGNPKRIKTTVLFLLLIFFCYMNIKMSNGYAKGWPYCDDAFNWNGYLQIISYIL